MRFFWNFHYTIEQLNADCRIYYTLTFFYKNTSLKKSKRSEHFNNTAEAQIEIQLEIRFGTVESDFQIPHE